MEAVEAAVKTFYTAPSEPERRAAQHWLEAFQSSPSAWTISFNILTTASLPQSDPVVFFAGQTLKQKTVQELAQLDDAGLRELTRFLEDRIFGRGPMTKAVRTQLSLALAAIFVQTRLTIDQKDRWYQLNPVAFLEFLSLLPEQINNRLIHLNEEQVNERKKSLLHDNANWVIPLFLSASVQRHDDVWRVGLVGLQSWIRYAEDILASSDALSLQILSVMLGIIDADPNDEMEAPSEVIIELCYACVENSQFTATFLSTAIPRLSTALTHTAEIKRIGGALIECGELLMRDALARHPTAIQHLVNAALWLTGQDDLEIVESTFNFWTELELLLGEERPEQREPFIPVFHRLFSLLLPRLRFPLHMTAEERDAFREFRHIIGDCLKDCVRVIGSSEALLLLSSAISSSNGDLMALEGDLFALRTIASVIDRRESEVLPQLLPSILCLTQHPRLVYSVLLILGALSDWIRYHQEETLEPAIKYIAAGLATSDQSVTGNELSNDVVPISAASIRSAAAQAMRYIGESNSAALLRHFDSLSNLYLSVVPLLAKPDQLSLTESMCHVISSATIDRHGSLLSPITAPFTGILGSSQSDPETIDTAMAHLALFIELVAPDSSSAVTSSYPTAALFTQLIEPRLPGLVNQHKLSISDGLTALLKAAAVRFSRGLGSIWLCSLVRQSMDWQIQQTFTGGLYVIRYVVLMCDCDDTVRGLIYSKLTQLFNAITPDAVLDLLQLLTSAFDYFRNVPEGLITGCKELIKQVACDARAPSGELSAAIQLSSRISAVSVDPQLLQVILDAALRHFPSTIQPDVAILLHRSHGVDPNACSLSVRAVLYNCTSVGERERSVWLQQYHEAVREPRPKALKSLIGVWAGVIRRRHTTPSYSSSLSSTISNLPSSTSSLSVLL